MLILPLFHWYCFSEWLAFVYFGVFWFALFVLSVAKRDTALAEWTTPEELIQAANAACSQTFTYEAATLAVHSGQLRLNSLNLELSCHYVFQIYGACLNIHPFTHSSGKKFSDTITILVTSND